MDLQKYELVSHVRGEIISSFVLSKEKEKILTFQKDQIPSGIVHFTLFDNKKRPVAERLVFNHNPIDQIKTTIDLPETMLSNSTIEGSIKYLPEADNSETAIASISIFKQQYLRSGN